MEWAYAFGGLLITAVTFGAAVNLAGRFMDEL
jgi:hypothetical protein